MVPLIPVFLLEELLCYRIRKVPFQSKAQLKCNQDSKYQFFKYTSTLKQVKAPCSFEFVYKTKVYHGKKLNFRHLWLW